MGILRFIFLSSVLVAIVLGAPADDKTEKKETVTTTVITPEKKDSNTDDRGVTVSDQSWDAYFSGSTWNVISGVMGTTLLIGGAGLAYYYFYYMTYYKVLDYTAAPYNPNYPYTQPTSSAYPIHAQYYANSARSLDVGNNWSWPKVLYMISLAQESYEKFDFQTLDCQKKALCELSHKQNDFGETGRKVSSTFSFLDAVEGLPMPSIIMRYLKEYKEAINQGKNSGENCATIYPKCTFSLKEVVDKYQKRAASEKF